VTRGPMPQQMVSCHTKMLPVNVQRVHKPARPTQQAADYQQMFEKEMQKRQSNNSKELVVLLLLLVTGQMGRKLKNPTRSNSSCGVSSKENPLSDLLHCC